jgi:hypothetical protein
MEVMVLLSNKMAKLGLVLLTCECRGGEEPTDLL